MTRRRTLPGLAVAAAMAVPGIGAPVAMAQDGGAVAAPRALAGPVAGAVAGTTTDTLRDRRRPPRGAEAIRLTLADVTLRCAACGPGGRLALPESVLRGSFADMIGQEMSLADAFGVIQRIETVYRDAGYVFSTAVIGAQAIDKANAVLEVSIAEGRIGSVTVAPTDESADIAPLAAQIARLARPLANSLQSPHPTRLEEIERFVLLVEDLPGVRRAAVTPRRGAVAGAVDLVTVVEFDRVSGAVFADNRQADTLGPGSAGVSVAVASVLLPGDELRGIYVNSFGDDFDDLGERNTGQIGYDAPLGSSGLRGRLRALHSRSDAGDQLAALDVEGDSTQVEASVEYPLIRTRDASIWLDAGAQLSESRTDALGGTVRAADDSLRVVHAGVRSTLRPAFGGTLSTRVQLRQGLDVFDASRRGDPGLSRSDADGSFTLVRSDVTAGVPLAFFENDFLRDRLSLVVSMAAQYAFDPLLGEEEFSIGGTRFGRGYDPSEIAGDSGFAIAPELRHTTRFEDVDVPFLAESVAFELDAYGFVDYGKVVQEGPAGSNRERSSHGLGLRLRSSTGTRASVELAFPHEDLLRTGDDDPRLFFSLNHIF